MVPDCRRFALSKLHPLLGVAVSLQGSDHICSTLSPIGMHLPGEMMSLQLEPLKVPCGLTPPVSSEDQRQSDANLLSAQAYKVLVQVILKTKAIVKGLVGLLNVV